MRQPRQPAHNTLVAYFTRRQNAPEAERTEREAPEYAGDWDQRWNEQRQQNRIAFSEAVTEAELPPLSPPDASQTNPAHPLETLDIAELPTYRPAARPTPELAPPRTEYPASVGQVRRSLPPPFPLASEPPRAADLLLDADALPASWDASDAPVRIADALRRISGTPAHWRTTPPPTPSGDSYVTTHTRAQMRVLLQQPPKTEEQIQAIARNEANLKWLAYHEQAVRRHYWHWEPQHELCMRCHNHPRVFRDNIEHQAMLWMCQYCQDWLKADAQITADYKHCHITKVIEARLMADRQIRTDVQPVRYAEQ
jgi:hypothetical protein